MKILQFNEFDLTGRRFNGYDLNARLRRLGHQATQCVIVKESDDPNVFTVTQDLDIHRRLIQLENKHQLYNQMLPYGTAFMLTDEFRDADVVHYHLVHNHMLALPDFPKLTAAKPSVWTWHDPWAMTGHCVHPRECSGWKSGCSPCRHLDEYFPIETDCAGVLWQLKQKVYQQMDADIVVSSEFMRSLAEESPLGRCFPRIHVIPFGIDVEAYGNSTAESARERLAVPPNDFVIAFRNEKNPYKGCEYIYRALDRMGNRQGVTLLTMGYTAVPDALRKRFRCIDLGWVSEPTVIADFYSACDVFLMPSVAESFGLMAVEAMASRRPVIVFEGTALPAVTYAPSCGLAVPKGDDEALYQAILRMKRDPQERRQRGEEGRRLALEHYRIKDYVRRHLELYEEVVARKGVPCV